MSKKTTTQSRKKTARREQLDAVPPGLVAAFTLIRMDDDNMHNPPHAARHAYPYARKVINVLRGQFDEDTNQDLLIEETLSEAAQRRYDDMSPDEVAESGALRGEVAFEVGFAVCWLLMTEMNGGAR